MFYISALILNLSIIGTTSSVKISAINETFSRSYINFRTNEGFLQLANLRNIIKSLDSEDKGLLLSIVIIKLIF